MKPLICPRSHKKDAKQLKKLRKEEEENSRIIEGEERKDK